MEILLIILILLGIGLFYVFRVGSMKYQVEFYLKRYAQVLSQGYSQKQAIDSLLTFYLKEEPYWKKEYMVNRYDNYVRNVDELIHDIVLFYYKIDPTFQVWKVDKLSAPANLTTLYEKLELYLYIYKKKYGILDKTDKLSNTDHYHGNSGSTLVDCEFPESECALAFKQVRGLKEDNQIQETEPSSEASSNNNKLKKVNPNKNSAEVQKKAQLDDMYDQLEQHDIENLRLMGYDYDRGKE